MFKKLTPLGRFTFIIIIVAILGFVGYKLTDNGKKLQSLSSGSMGGSYDATLFVDTYTGWAPIVWGNGGKQGTKDSYFYKNFGVRLDIKNADDFDASRKAWQNDPNAIAFCTLDSYPVEAGEKDGMSDARYFMIHNFSADKEKTLEITKDMIPNAKVCADFLGSADAAHLSVADGKITLPALSSVVIKSAG